MQVRAAAAASVATASHQLPFFDRQFVGTEQFGDAIGLLGILLTEHRLANLAGVAVEVHIYGCESVRVLDVQYLATAPGRDAHLGHVSVGGSVDRLADGAAGAHVKAAVEVVGTELGEGGAEAYVGVQRVAEIALWQLLGVESGKWKVESDAGAGQ